jgi:hypothetical protein
VWILCPDFLIERMPDDHVIPVLEKHYEVATSLAIVKFFYDQMIYLISFDSFGYLLGSGTVVAI